MSGLRCQAKRGVMTLRRCDEPATDVCTMCQRPTCAAHFSPKAVRTCFDCVAKENPAAAHTEPNMADYDRPGWAFGMHHWVFYSGGFAEGRFDRADERSFQHRRDDDVGEAASKGGSFLDS